MIMGTKARTSRAFKVSAIGVTAVLALSACGGAGGDKKKDSAPAAGKEGSTKLDNNPQPLDKLEKGGTLQLAVGEIGPDFNNFSTNGNTADLSSIYGAINTVGLWSSKADGTPILDPDYAEDAKSEIKDGKQVITYKLNPKAKWNDGTPVDFNALKHHAELFSGKNKDYAIVTSSGYEDIEKIERGDNDHHIIVTMKKHYFPWQGLFGSVIHPAINTPEIFNKGFAKPHPEWMAGPFKLDKYDPAAKIISMVPNEKWWGKKPLLDKIVYRAMAGSAEVAAFKNGEIDAVGIASQTRYKQAAGTPNADERRGQRLSVFGIVFNAKSDSLIKDVTIRKAMWQAVDPQRLRDVRFKGLNWEESRPGSWMSMPFSPLYENNLPVKYSKEDAQKTLEEAGWKKGSDGFYAKDGKKLTVKLTTFGNEALVAAMSQTLQGQMKEVGIELAVDNRPDSAFQETMAKKKFDTVMMGYGVGSDPTNVPKQFYRSDGENLSGTGTPEVDKMINDFVPTDNTKERAKVANAIEKKAMEQYGMLPLWNGPVIALYRKGLANYGPSLYQSTDWSMVGFEKGSTHK